MLYTLGIRYQVSGILNLSGEPLGKGYYMWHLAKKRQKVHVHKTNAKMNTQKWRCKNTTVKTMLVNDCQFHVTENTFEFFF